MAKKYIPNKTVKVRPSEPSWLTTHIKKTIRKRKRIFDKFKRTNSDNDINKYKSYRNKVTNEIRKSKTLQIEKLSDKLRNKTNGPKDWCKTLKIFIKPLQTSSIPPLIVDGHIYSDSADKANLFKDYFTEQSSLDDTYADLPTELHLPDYIRD